MTFEECQQLLGAYEALVSECMCRNLQSGHKLFEAKNTLADFITCVLYKSLK